MRAWIAALIFAFGIFTCGVEAIGILTHGHLPEYTSVFSEPGVREVVHVSREASAAGLRTGDRLVLRDNWPFALANEGWASHGWLSAGSSVPVVVERRGSHSVLHITLAPASRAMLLPMWLDIAFKFAAVIVGLLLVVRGRDAFGLFAGIGIAGASLTSGFVSNIALGQAGVSAVADALIFSVAVFGRYFLVEAMLTICGDGLRPIEQKIIRITAIAGSAFMVVTVLTVTLATLAQNAAIASMWGNQSAWATLWFLAQLSLRIDLLGYLIAWIRPGATDRDVIAWTFAATFIGLAGPTVNLLIRLFGMPVPAYGALNLTLVLMAAGYAYVAMRYRIVNISFVLNRAVVYTAVGGLILSVFVIVEVLATRLAVGRTGSTLLEMLVALTLGFTVKRLEQRVDALVERVLFASKHRLEERLRELISDCSHVEHLPALFARACSDSRRILGADRVTAYEVRDNAYEPVYTSPEGVPVPWADVDDGAFVRLRSRREAIDLEDLGSALGSEGIVFPMLARGRLLGAMYFGPKAKRSTYDPDERKLLLELSHEVGASSLVLSAAQPTPR
jgi:hypothetical protein